MISLMLVRIMNWVSRHILLAPFMCLFLLFACGSSHKTVKSDIEVIRKDSAGESVNVIHSSITSLRELIATEGNYVIDFRIYDTRKPPDSLTGQSPLLADGQVEGNFNQKQIDSRWWPILRMSRLIRELLLISMRKSNHQSYRIKKSQHCLNKSALLVFVQLY